MRTEQPSNAVLFSSLIIIFDLILGATNVWAEEQTESFVHYDSIVNELKASADQDLKAEHEETNYIDSGWHGGLAFAGTYVSILVPESEVPASGLLKGFEANGGVSLGYKVARAELAVRNFATDTISNSIQAQVREAEARLVFTPALTDDTVLRMGMGVAERYMHIWTQNSSYASLTPFYSLMVGCEKRIAPTVSIGPDFSYHSSLDASSFDKSSWDASFRLNATF